jgi:hypothetical protein
MECGGGGLPTSPAPVTTVDPNNPVTNNPPVSATPDPDPVLPTTPPVIPAPGNASTFVNVLGDTGWCGSPALGPLARLFDRFDGDILLAGDLAYPSGTMDDFRNCFEPSFGKFKSRMRASPGNHDYVGQRRSSRSLLRRSAQRRPLEALQLPRGRVDGLHAELERAIRSPRPVPFVRTTMQQTPTRCTMAVMHHPFDSSGINGPTPSLRDIWELMYNLGGDVVIAGHDHLYERHSPVNTDQRRDDAKGIRQFTVGTGGAPLYSRVRGALNSELLISNYGVLRLKLDPALYEWQFMDMNGNILDHGLNVCH